MKLLKVWLGVLVLGAGPVAFAPPVSAAPLPYISGSLVYEDGTPATGARFQVNDINGDSRVVGADGRFSFQIPATESQEFNWSTPGSRFGSTIAVSYRMDVRQDRDLGVIPVRRVSPSSLRTVDVNGDPVAGVEITGISYLESGPYDFDVHPEFEVRFAKWSVGGLRSDANGYTRLDVPDLDTSSLPTGIGANYTDRSGTKHSYDLSSSTFDGTSWVLRLDDVDVPSQAAPDAPTGVTAVAGDGSALVTWSKPDDHGSPITRYEVSSDPSSGAAVLVDGSKTSLRVAGLINGRTYVFTVVAVNNLGSSPASTRSSAVTPAAAPSRMSRPVVKTKGRTATITWNAPDDGGAAITRYRVEVDRRSYSVTPGKTRLVVRNLSSGSHVARVAASNAAGESQISKPTPFKV